MAETQRFENMNKILKIHDEWSTRKRNLNGRERVAKYYKATKQDNKRPMEREV